MDARIDIDDLERQIFPDLLTRAIDVLANLGRDDYPIEVTAQNAAMLERLIRSMDMDGASERDMLARLYPGSTLTLAHWQVLAVLRSKIDSLPAPSGPGLAE